MRDRPMSCMLVCCACDAVWVVNTTHNANAENPVDRGEGGANLKEIRLEMDRRMLNIITSGVACCLGRKPSDQSEFGLF